MAARLVEIIARWLDNEPACRALAIAGSWARGDATPDSDLDLLILTPTIERWKDNADWLPKTGLAAAGHRVISSARVQYGVVFSWHVLLHPDARVEFTFADLSWAKGFPVDPGTRRVVSDGIEIMIDKDGLLALLRRQVRQQAACIT